MATRGSVVRLRISSDHGSEVRQFPSGIVRLGRDPQCELHFNEHAFPTVSGRHAQIETTVLGLKLTHLSQTNQTYVDGQAVDASRFIFGGNLVRLGKSGPFIEVLDEASSELDTANFGRTMQATDAHMALLRGSAAANTAIPILHGGMIGRSDGGARFAFDHRTSRARTPSFP